MVLVPPNQLPLNLAANPQLLQSIRSFPQQANKQGGSNQMPQLDGSAELLVPSSSGVPKPAKSKKKPTVPQLDGGGPGMTDSSSEEEEEEEDDPLHRYAGLQNVGADDGEVGCGDPVLTPLGERRGAAELGRRPERRGGPGHALRLGQRGGLPVREGAPRPFQVEIHPEGRDHALER